MWNQINEPQDNEDDDTEHFVDAPYPDANASSAAARKAGAPAAKQGSGGVDFVVDAAAARSATETSTSGRECPPGGYEMNKRCIAARMFGFEPPTPQSLHPNP